MLEEQAKAAAEAAANKQVAEPLPVDAIKISDLELRIATIESDNRALQLENYELRESKDKLAKLQALYLRPYHETKGRQKADSASQTDHLDHYAIFSLLLKEILREAPELRSNVLPQAKFMDMYWKYFALADELKKYIRELPKVRGKQA